MKNVFLVILSYKGHKDTHELLNSLQKVKTDDFLMNVVVVDNCPSDQIKIDLKEFKDLNLHVIYNEKNLGFSGGNNVGIKYSAKNNADYIVVQNNDTLVDPEYIKELIKAAESNDQIGAVVPKIYFAKGYEFHKERYRDEDIGKVIWYGGGYIDWKNVLGNHKGVDEVDKGQYDNEEETELATGCCILIKRKIIDEVLGYDDRYFLYYEDADLSQRIQGVGYKLFYAPKAVIWHKNAQSTGGSGSDLQDYFITRNRLLFGMRFAGLRAKAALIKESLKLLSNGRKWQKKGVIDYYLRKFEKGSYPLE